MHFCRLFILSLFMFFLFAPVQALPTPSVSIEGRGFGHSIKDFGFDMTHGRKEDDFIQKGIQNAEDQYTQQRRDAEAGKGQMPPGTIDDARKRGRKEGKANYVAWRESEESKKGK